MEGGFGGETFLRARTKDLASAEMLRHSRSGNEY